MMYIKSLSDYQQLHIPGDIPWIDEADVVEVQADGDELNAILSTFGTSIPVGNSRVQRWFGDTAKSIVANMKFGV